MGFFSQAGKKKKKGQPGYKEEFQEIAAKGGSPKKNELEKTMFLTPEERYISKGKEGRRTEQEETAPDCSGERTVRGEPIIINGPDYLLRINETRMEGSFTVSEKRLWKNLRRGSRIMKRP